MHVSRRGREGPDEIVLGIDADVVMLINRAFRMP